MKKLISFLIIFFLSTASYAGTLTYSTAEIETLLGYVNDSSAFGRTLWDDANAAATMTTLGFSANAQSLVAAADYSAMRTLLSLVPGTNVQAYDADLATWATVTPSANGKSLVSAANYAAMRGLLDLEAGTDFYSKTAADSTFQPLDGELTAIAGLTSAADKVPYFTGSGTASVADATIYGRSLWNIADEAAFKSLVNLEAGTDFYSVAGADTAFESELDNSAGLMAALSDETGGGVGALSVFSISPNFTTDITVQALTGNSAYVAITADAGEDNDDRYHIAVADSGAFAIGSYALGSWNYILTLTNTGVLTPTSFGNDTVDSDAIDWAQPITVPFANYVRWGDSGIYTGAPSDGQLSIVSDTLIESTSPTWHHVGSFYASTYGSDGSVSDTEFKRINTLSDNAQDQINLRVIGDASVTDDRVATFNADGYNIQDTPVEIDSSGNMSGLLSLTMDTVQNPAFYLYDTDDSPDPTFGIIAGSDGVDGGAEFYARGDSALKLGMSMSGDGIVVKHLAIIEDVYAYTTTGDIDFEDGGTILLDGDNDSTSETITVIDGWGTFRLTIVAYADIDSDDPAVIDFDSCTNCPASITLDKVGENIDLMWSETLDSWIILSIKNDL